MRCDEKHPLIRKCEAPNMTIHKQTNLHGDEALVKNSVLFQNLH